MEARVRRIAEAAESRELTVQDVTALLNISENVARKALLWGVQNHHLIRKVVPISGGGTMFLYRLPKDSRTQPVADPVRAWLYG